MAQNLREYRRGTLRKHLSPNILTSSSFSLTSTNSLCHAMDSSFFSFEYAVTEFKAALFINFTSYILKWITLEAYRSNGILSRSCFVKTYFAFRRFLSFYSFFPPRLVSFLPLGCSSDRSSSRFSSSPEKKNRDS